MKIRSKTLKFEQKKDEKCIKECIHFNYSLRNVPERLPVAVSRRDEIWENDILFLKTAASLTEPFEQELAL